MRVWLYDRRAPLGQQWRVADFPTPLMEEYTLSRFHETGRETRGFHPIGYFVHDVYRQRGKDARVFDLIGTAPSRGRGPWSTDEPQPITRPFADPDPS